MGMENLGAQNHRNGTGAFLSLTTGWLATEVIAFRNGQEVQDDPDNQVGSTPKDMSMVESIARKVVGELALAGLVVAGVAELVFRAALALVMTFVVLPLSCLLMCYNEDQEPAVAFAFGSIFMLASHAFTMAMTVGALFENVRTGFTGEELEYNNGFIHASNFWDSFASKIQ
jgi:hypothetical protein